MCEIYLYELCESSTGRINLCHINFYRAILPPLVLMAKHLSEWLCLLLRLYLPEQAMGMVAP